MWRLPLVVVIVTLIALTAAPLAVSRVVYGLRRRVQEYIDPARVLTTHAHADIAVELFTIAERAATGDGALTARLGNLEHEERGDEAALDSLVRHADAEAVERFVEFRVAARQLADLATTVQANAARMDPAAVVAIRSDGERALSAAERLEDHLLALSNAERNRIRQLERVDVWLPVALAPFGLVSVLLVLRLGERTMALAEEAERGRRNLAQAVEAKAALMRGVSHDLKNPLGAAAGYAELLKDGFLGPLSDRQLEVVGRLRRLLEVSLESIADLLTLSRADGAQLRIEHTRTDLLALALEVAGDFRAAARAAALSLTVAPMAERVVVLTDAVRVRQILGNLVSNAIKYTPSGGRVVVDVRREERNGRSWALVEARDTGPGIPPEYREQVFDEFFRVPGSTSVPGEGVGLAISRWIARNLGGDLVASEPVADGEGPAHGARFVLRIPAGDGSDEPGRSS